jgi:hypothetical protein
VVDIYQSRFGLDIPPGRAATHSAAFFGGSSIGLKKEEEEEEEKKTRRDGFEIYVHFQTQR